MTTAASRVHAVRTQPMKNRVLRTLWHVSVMLLAAAVTHFASWLNAVLMAGGYVVLAWGTELLRRVVPASRPYIHMLFRPIIREDEYDGISGASPQSVGILLPVLFCPAPVAALAFVMSALGDPAARAAGMTFGGPSYFTGKTIAGSVGCALVCGLVAALFGWAMGLGLLALLLFALGAGVIGAVAEASSAIGINDNFMMPVVAAVLLWGLMAALGMA